MGLKPNWTAEEEEYLRNSWGNVSVAKICENLNRSRNAILIRVQRLGLPPFYDSGDYVTVHQLLLALGYGGSDSYKNLSWVRNRDFPVQYKKHTEKRVKIVCLDEFWEWAEKNAGFLDFSNFEWGALGEEPEWVAKKRKQDYQLKRQYKKTPWTPLEDQSLKRLLKEYKYSYLEIAQKLQRTEGAVQRRILDLGLKERPIKADNHNLWTEEQIQALSYGIKNRERYEMIQRRIPDKSVKSIRGYVYRFYLTENLDTVRSCIGDGTFGDNLPGKKVKHFRVMSPEERGEAKDLLSVLAYSLNQRARQISTVSEEFKDFWQKETCQHWDDALGCTAGENNCDSCTSYCRIKPQYCSRCGASVYKRYEVTFCDACLIARKKQAQKKWAILYNRQKRKEERNEKHRRTQ